MHKRNSPRRPNWSLIAGLLSLAALLAYAVLLAPVANAEPKKDSAGFDLSALAREEAARTGVPAFATTGVVARIAPTNNLGDGQGWIALEEAPGQGFYFRDVVLRGGFTFRCTRPMGLPERWAPAECGGLGVGDGVLVVGRSTSFRFKPRGLSEDADRWTVMFPAASELMVISPELAGATRSAFADPPPKLEAVTVIPQ